MADLLKRGRTSSVRNVMDADRAEEKAERMLKMELDELIELCEEMDIDSSEFVADSEFQSAILEVMKKTAQYERAKPVLSGFASSFGRDVAVKRKRVVQLVKSVQAFVEDRAARIWLKKLRLNQTPAWMKSQDFKRVRGVATNVKPVLLFAGSTSSGKSTLLNALLGASILPTSHSAATSALCEIKYSDNGTNYAVMHIQEGRVRKREEVDLSSEEGFKIFSKLTADRPRARRVSLTRTLSSGSQKSASSSSLLSLSELSELKPPEPKAVCVMVEIYWPLKFLEDFSLVDSPGVTEEEGSSTARQITEEFQRDHACGYVYVLDGTRAAEEAAQVGGLLRSVVKATKSAPASSSAVFVINKWDLVVQQQTEFEQKEYLRKVAQCIEQRWPGFDAERQLITMNAKIASQAQELGYITPDLQLLCDKIQKALPTAVDNLVLKQLSCVGELLGQIEQSIDGMLRYLHLPFEDRIQALKRDRKQLHSLTESQTSGSLASTRREVQHRIEEIVLELSHYLKSKEAFEFVAEHRKKSAQDSTTFDTENVQDIVEKGLSNAICQYPKIELFRKWAVSFVLPVVEELIGELARIRGFNTQVRPISLEQMISGQIDSSRVERIHFIVGAAALALPINWPGFLLGGLAMAIGGEQIGQAVMKVLCPGTWVYAGLHKKLFWDTTEKVYNDVVQKFCENKNEKLHQFVTKLLEDTVDSVGMLCREIPRCIEIIENDLKARVSQEEGSAPNFSAILMECRKLKGQVSAFMLAQNIHLVDTTQLDRGLVAVSDLISKISLPKKGEAMLKRFPERIRETNADEVLKRMTINRNVVTDHIVSFYGSVVLVAEPLHLGLVFEWCSGGSLSDMIYDPDHLPPCHRTGFRQYKTILLQLLNGLKYIHGVGIIHAGLTPKTIMFTKDNRVKLCEVKSPNRLYTSTSNRMSCNRDDLVYLAPEILNSQPCNVSCDIYSLGLILWEIWNGKMAFSNFNFASIDEYPKFVNEVNVGTRPEGFKQPEQSVSSDTSSLDKPCSDKSLAQEWKELTCHCWEGAPSKRPTAKDVYNTVLTMGKAKECV